MQLWKESEYVENWSSDNTTFFCSLLLDVSLILLWLLTHAKPLKHCRCSPSNSVKCSFIEYLIVLSSLEYIQIYIQQDATLHSLFISGNCSTCFGWYLHPSSGAHTTVYTASGVRHTVTATCRYNGVTNTRCCIYSCMRSWWWVEVPPEICGAVSRYK